MNGESKRDTGTRRRMPWSRVVVAVAIAQVYWGPVHGAELTAGVPSVAKPQEFKFGDVTVIGKGTMTSGTIIRADDRDPKLIPQGNGASIGVNGKARGGVNNDDGDLNYDRGDRVSTVLKVVTDADVKYKNLGMFARLKAWYDFVQEDKDVRAHLNRGGGM